MKVKKYKSTIPLTKKEELKSSLKYKSGTQAIQAPPQGKYVPDYYEADTMGDKANAGKQVGETVSSTLLNAAVPGLGSIVKPLNGITDKLTKKEDGTYKSQAAESLAFLNPLNVVNRLSEGIATGSTGDIVDAFTFGFGSKVFGLKTNAEKQVEKRKQAEAAAKINNLTDSLKGISNTQFQSMQYERGVKSIKMKNKC